MQVQINQSNDEYEERLKILGQELKNCLDAWNNDRDQFEQEKGTTNKFDEFMTEMGNRIKQGSQLERTI